jgi:hypothetical protein
VFARATFPDMIHEIMLKRFLLLSLAVALVFGYFTLFVRPPFTQIITGRLLNAAMQARVAQLRFLRGSGDASCTADGIEVLTDSDGRFEFETTYRPSPIELVAVRLNSYSLCEKSESGWQLLWNITTGPAPHFMYLECTVTAIQGEGCYLPQCGIGLPSLQLIPISNSQ